MLPVELQLACLQCRSVRGKLSSRLLCSQWRQWTEQDGEYQALVSNFLHQLLLPLLLIMYVCTV